MISESTRVFRNTPVGETMDEAIEFNLEKISSMTMEQEAFPSTSRKEVNPGKNDSKDKMEANVVVDQTPATDPEEEAAKCTSSSPDEVDAGFQSKPLENQGTDQSPKKVVKRNQNDKTHQDRSGNLDNEVTLSQPPPPFDATSPSAGPKTKFQVVHNNGRMTLRLTRNEEASPQGRKSLQASPTTPKAKSKPRRASDMGTPQKTKTATEKSIGGKTRNKVMSPRSSAVDTKSSTLSSPNKPLMDLRHILKKYEKKKEPVPQQQAYDEVGFYGSLSAIPFLTMNNDKAVEKSTTKKEKKNDNRSGNSLSDSPKDQTKVGADSLKASEDEIIPEKPRLPTREEIVVTAEYDEDQLRLWKSMTSFDSSRHERPQEMLPLRPGVRSEKKMASPRNSGVRAFSRPEEWLGHPEWNSSQKSYRSISSDEPPVDDVLVMEPDD